MKLFKNRAKAAWIASVLAGGVLVSLLALLFFTPFKESKAYNSTHTANLYDETAGKFIWDVKGDFFGIKFGTNWKKWRLRRVIRQLRQIRR